MQLFAVVMLLGAALADRLDNTYLPPKSAQGAGGNGNFLSAPDSRYTGAATSGSGAYSNRGGVGGTAAGSDHNPEAAAIQTLRFDNDNNGDGNYRYEYETENKITHQEMGELVNAGSDAETTVVRGSYSFEGPDGVTYTVNYIADENGFQATGDHLPVAPEIPEAIQRSIEQNAREEEAESRNNQQGYSRGGPSGSASNEQGYPSGGPAASATNNYASNGNGHGNNGNGYPAATSASKQYLPPGQQGQQTQNRFQQQAPTNQYLPPQQQAQRQQGPSSSASRPSNQYLPPQGRRNGY